MSKFFENINKNSVQLDVLHGWDVNKEWYIDIKMTGFLVAILESGFTSEKNYKNS